MQGTAAAQSKLSSDLYTCKNRMTFVIRFFSGERGIRTPGPVKINSFQDCRIRPLCHLSNMFPFVRECKGTNKIETSKLFLRFFFRREKFPLEKHQIDCSAGHAAVSKVKDCAEEGARIVHPRELIVKQREVEHVHYLSEHECERSAWHDSLRPDETVEVRLV